MDTDQLLITISAFIEALNAYLWDSGRRNWESAEEHRQRALELVPAAQAIARVIRDAPDPGELLPDHDLDYRDTYAEVLHAALRLKGSLVAQRDLAEALRPDGPEVSTNRLHSWVREAAASLWAGGNYRQAVHAAAVVVDEHLKAKLGRDDVSGTDLARQAFSLDEPTANRPRLRFDWVSPTSETFRSVHDGARDFGAGCAQVIRNTAAHRSEQLEETVAIEQLAALSYWARLIDTASVVRGSE